MDKWEGKQHYIDKRNKLSREIVDGVLTDEQINAIEDLARIRHEIHSNLDNLWNVDSSSYNRLWNYLDDEADNSINQMLKNVDLPLIDIGDIYGIPNNNWYYEDEEEQKGYADSWDWRENSGRYEEFVKDINAINDVIETYLCEIDKKHGTQYAPTGYARLTL